MIQIFTMAIHNVEKHKGRSFFTIVLFFCVITLSAISTVLLLAMREYGKDKQDEIVSKKTIQISGINGRDIDKSVIDMIRDEVGVADVIPWYDTAVLLEDQDSNPLYIITLCGFDFEKWRFPGADDYRGKNIEGVLLPDISYDFHGRKTLRNYIGQDVRLTYETENNGNYTSKTILARVVGVYEATGTPESNPVFMSKALFQNVLDEYGDGSAGIFRAQIYPTNGMNQKELAKRISEYGVDVSFESLLDDFQSFIESFTKLVSGVDLIVIVLLFIVLMQNLNNGVRNRYKEIGVLKAFGHPAKSLYQLVVFEWLVYWLVASIVSSIVLLLCNGWFKELTEFIVSGINVELSWKIIVLTCFFAGAISILTILLPIRAIQKMRPIDVLRENYG